VTKAARACLGNHAAPLGGATRILIIDDDPRPAHPQGRSVSHEAGLVDGLALNGLSGVDQSSTDSEGRPVVHEYQMPTPLPLTTEQADAGSEPDQPGSTDVSVVRELIARVEELLHRTRRLPAGASTGWAGTIRFGTVLVEPATQTVLRQGQPVRVTHTEFRLLLALMRRRGAIASRIELLREVWGTGAAVSRRAVDTHIARLRRKLEDDPANPRHILTALAWGYRFRA
jgi:two-component system KDP operon response regulator KdpE